MIFPKFFLVFNLVVQVYIMTKDHDNNNLLHPPRLTFPSTSASGAAALNMTDLTEQISNIVRDILTKEGRQIMSNIINPQADIKNDLDQIIDTQVDHTLSDLDKIPDIVKSLRDFSGSPGEFSSWKKSVDRILKLYEHLKGSSKYYGILSVVRNKIVGNADRALESYNTPLNWNKISRCLTLHYADKRDLGTLEYQMTTLVQGNYTIPEFYQNVYQHLSLILNKLSCMEMGQESMDNMTQSYRDKALDTFIRGLKGDLPRLLSIREPVDLPQALHLCLKLQNVDFRTQYANNSNYNSQRRITPPIPPRRSNVQNQNSQFYPQLLHNPQGFTNPYTLGQHRASFAQNQFPRHQFQRHFPNQFPRQQFQQHFSQNQIPRHQQPNKPSFGHSPNQLPKPEPMDVDRSLRSRQINYMNRPQPNQFPQKRPFNSYQSTQTPNKLQRVFHTEQDIEETDFQEQERYENDRDESHIPTEYEDPYENPSFDQPEELEDLSFLD